MGIYHAVTNTRTGDSEPKRVCWLARNFCARVHHERGGKKGEGTWSFLFWCETRKQPVSVG